MITKFYIEHKHDYVDIKNMTFTDYMNVDYRVADQIFKSYIDMNGLVVTDDNRDQLRSEMVYNFLQYEREYA